MLIKIGNISDNAEGTKEYLASMTSDSALKNMNTSDLINVNAFVEQQQAMKQEELNVEGTKFSASNNFDQLEKNENTKNEVPDILSSSERGKAFKAKVETAIKNKDETTLSASFKELSKEKGKISQQRVLLDKEFKSKSWWFKNTFSSPYTRFKIGKYSLSDYDQQMFKIADAQVALNKAREKVKEAKKLDETKEKVEAQLTKGFDAAPSEKTDKSKTTGKPEVKPPTAKTDGEKSGDSNLDSTQSTEQLEDKTSTSSIPGVNPPTARDIATKAADKYKKQVKNLQTVNEQTNNGLAKAIVDTSAIQAESQERLAVALNTVAANSKPQVITQILPQRSTVRPKFVQTYNN